MAAGPSPFQELTPAHSSEPSLSGQSVQRTSLSRWESLGLSQLVSPPTTHFLGNPSPTLAIWLSLPGTSQLAEQACGYQTPLSLPQGSWVLVVGVFPAAPPACCEMLLKFSPRSWSPHRPIRGMFFVLFLSALWVLVLKL